MKNKLKFALIQQALLRWENAVLIALAILLTAFLPQPFPFWPVWGWGVLALVGVIAITISSLGEPEVQSAAIDDMLYQEYNPDEIKTPSIRASFHAKPEIPPHHRTDDRPDPGRGDQNPPE